jgi:hypothetical protein
VKTIVIGCRKRVPVPLVLASLSGDTYQELTFRGSLFDWILAPCLRKNSVQNLSCPRTRPNSLNAKSGMKVQKTMILLGKQVIETNLVERTCDTFPCISRLIISSTM